MKKRIFIAADISNDAKMNVAEYIENLRRDFANLKVGWERSEKLHITLKFLGDVENKKITELIEVIENIAVGFSKFPISIKQNGVFPSPKKARILWLGLEDKKGSLRKLNDSLETECEKIGFSKEKRNFSPHLTIARLREPHRSNDLVKRHLETKFEPVGFEVSEIVFYESKLQKTGSVYFPIKRISI